MRNINLGIIGGGQLGMLLTQAAIQFPIHVSIYDPNPKCPASNYTKNYVQGDFDDFDAIVEFGKSCDVIIFELEKVNVKALLELQKMGKKVVSNPSDLLWIQDKGIQREKLAEQGFPMPKFENVAAADVRNYSGDFPVVQKWRTGGYDGYGVQIHENAESLAKAKEVDSIFEEKVEIKTELSVIVARDKTDTKVYPPVEMVFDPEANLVDHLISPAQIDQALNEKAIDLAKQIAEAFDFYGVYAIEMFLTESGEILVNEIAPRTHNSGHHTVSANITSQYEQQIRITLNLPLGSVEMISPCVLVNLLGDDATGPTNYEGIEQAYKIPNVQYVLYGKDEVKPKRKMGHALILEKDIPSALEKVKEIRNTLTITSYE